MNINSNEKSPMKPAGKSRWITILAGAMVILLLWTPSILRHMSYHSWVRLYIKVEPEPGQTNNPAGIPDSGWDEKKVQSAQEYHREQIKFISSLLNNTQDRETLAKVSGVELKDFSAASVHAVRNLNLYTIYFSCVNSNVACTVGSNAANTVLKFYDTNFPQRKAKFLELVCSPKFPSDED